MAAINQFGALQFEDVKGISKTRLGAQYITFRDGPVNAHGAVGAERFQGLMPQQGALLAMFRFTKNTSTS
jgi:hypothetical protein